MLDFAKLSEDGGYKNKKMVQSSEKKQMPHSHTLPSRPVNIVSEEFDHFFNFLPQLDLGNQSKSMIKAGQNNIFLNDFNEGLDPYLSKYEPDPNFFTKYGGELSPHLPH